MLLFLFNIQILFYKRPIAPVFLTDSAQRLAL
jgi:hypothetical protein